MFVLYREKYQICAGRHRAGEMRMGAAKKRKIEVRHYIIGIAVFVVAVAVSLIIFFLASSRMIRDKSEDAMRENSSQAERSSGLHPSAALPVSEQCS